MQSRRQFMKETFERSALLAMAPAVPGFIARTARAAVPDRQGQILVVVQLDGGNDGINTVVPFRDEGYAKHRLALRLPTDRLLKISDSVALHPSMAEAAKLLERGELAIVQGVGYPNPSRSHFRSMAVWHSASLDPELHSGPGWLGRAFDGRLGAGDKAGAFFLGGGQPPAALRGRRSAPATLERAQDLILSRPADVRASIGEQTDKDDLAQFVRRTTLDAYTTAAGMAAMARTEKSGSADGDSLRGRLALIIRLIKSGAAARVYYTEHSGYDTHAGQLGTHANLLSELSQALGSFQTRLAAAGLAERVVNPLFQRILAGESPRTLQNGTDHGTSGPVFLGRQGRAGRRFRADTQPPGARGRRPENGRRLSQDLLRGAPVDGWDSPPTWSWMAASIPCPSSVQGKRVNWRPPALAQEGIGGRPPRGSSLSTSAWAKPEKAVKWPGEIRSASHRGWPKSLKFPIHRHMQIRHHSFPSRPRSRFGRLRCHNLFIFHVLAYL